MKLTLTEWMYLLSIVGLLGVAPAIWVVKSHFEAAAYNRLTGAHATTWDAMWVELRVQDSPKTK